jgi:hypothetical protein
MISEADYLAEKRAESLMIVGRIFDELIASAAVGEPVGIVAAKVFLADEANGLLAALANLLLPAGCMCPVNCMQPAFSYPRAALIDRLTASVLVPATSRPTVLSLQKMDLFSCTSRHPEYRPLQYQLSVENPPPAAMRESRRSNDSYGRPCVTHLTRRNVCQSRRFQSRAA